MKKWHEYTPDERAAWRRSEMTTAALELLTYQRGVAADATLEAARSDDTAVIKYRIGLRDGLAAALGALTEDR